MRGSNACREDQGNSARRRARSAATIKARILDEELRALGLSIGPEHCEAIMTAIEQRLPSSAIPVR